MNESASILLLCIVGVWFYTSPRSQAFLHVLQMPANSPLPGTPDYYQQNQTWDPTKQSNAPTYDQGKAGYQQPTGGQMA